MIIFDGTKEVSGNSFLLFKNEHEEVIELCLNKQTTDFILRHFELLEPPLSKMAEKSPEAPMEDEPEMVRILPTKNVKK